jgi:hypothetical protein
MAQHVTVPGSIVFNPRSAFSQEGLYNTLRLIKPQDPSLTVVSIAIPFVGVNCKEFGIIDPIAELKKAAERLYDYFIKYYIQPVWNALYSLYEALKNLGLGIIDLAIGIFDLHISDLFDPNLFATIKAKVLDWYYNRKQDLIDLLNTLGIRFPFTFSLKSAELEIEELVKAICNSLWAFLIRAFKKLIALCSQGVALWEAIYNQSIPTWSQIIEKAQQAIMGFILDFLTNVPTITDIFNALEAFAKRVWNKAVVTFQEILAVIQDFTFGIFGKLFNFSFPKWNPNSFNPEIDLMRILNQMHLYLKNFLLSIITNFVKAIADVLQFFGVTILDALTFEIPITLCAVVNDTTGTTTTPVVPIP